MNVKTIFLRVRREQREMSKIMGQAIPKGYAGLVKLADGTYEYQVRSENADGTWTVVKSSFRLISSGRILLVVTATSALVRMAISAC